jgi:hypothetical protein
MTICSSRIDVLDVGVGLTLVGGWMLDRRYGRKELDVIKLRIMAERTSLPTL